MFTMVGGRVGGIAVLCLGLFAAAAPAQDIAAVAPVHVESERTGLLPAFTLRRDVREVEVWFTAADREGRPVNDLSASQVAVHDDGRPVEALAYFQRHTGISARMVMLVDGSDSMRRRFAAARAAALAVRARSTLAQAPGVFYFVGRNVYCEAGCAAPALADMRPEGETPLFDQLLALAGRMELPARSGARNVVALFSDGEDNWSRTDLEAVVQALQQRNIAVYTITAHSRRLEFAGDRVLRRLAQATGGRAFFLSRYQDAPRVLAKIESELRTQYVLGFRPEAAAPWSYHQLRIEAQGRAVHINARAGYLLQP